MNDQTQNNDTDTAAAASSTEQEELDDIEIESYNDNNLEGGEMTSEDKIKDLRQKLKVAVKEKQEYLDGWQRLKADFANYKKREEDGKSEFMKFAREGLVADLLPVLESFQMAFANKEAWEKIDKSWRSGVEYINTQLVQVLGGHGLTEMRPLGEEYDPHIHTSIGNIPTDDKAQEHRIAEVVQPGYQLAGKVIRSPKVKIFSLEGEGAT